MYPPRGIFTTPWVVKAAFKNIGGYIDFNVILWCGFCRYFWTVTCLFYARRADRPFSLFRSSTQSCIIRRTRSTSRVTRYILYYYIYIIFILCLYYIYIYIYIYIILYYIILYYILLYYHLSGLIWILV